MDKTLLIGVSARIYYPGTPGIAEEGVWTKTLHYLEQSIAHWIMRGGAMAVMIPAVDSSSVVTRDDLNLTTMPPRWTAWCCKAAMTWHPNAMAKRRWTPPGTATASATVTRWS